MSEALELAKWLHSRRDEIIGWHVLVADINDVRGSQQHQFKAYFVQEVALHERDPEINLLVEYTEDPILDDAMPAQEFADRLLLLVNDHPDFAIEASVKVELMIEGTKWNDFHMPVRTIVGSPVARAVIVGVDGLRYLQNTMPPPRRSDS